MPSLDTMGSLADRLLKLAIVLVLLVTLLGPLLVITFHFASPRIVDAVVRYALGKQFTSSDETRITTGPDYYTVEDLQSRLVQISAYRGEARGAAKALQVLLIRQERALPADAKARVFTQLKLDLSGAAETATVIMPDRPVLVDMGSGAPARRAMLAVEGVAPFDLKGAPQGLLAGFRISSFGGGLVARPEQFIERRDPRIFCTSIKNWLAFYGLPTRALRLTVAVNATALRVSDEGVSGDGDLATATDELRRFCTSL